MHFLFMYRCIYLFIFGGFREAFESGKDDFFCKSSQEYLEGTGFIS